MKYIEKQILLDVNKRIPLRRKLIMILLRKYTFDIYKMGYDDGFLLGNWQGCNKAVIIKKQTIEK